MLLRHFGEVPSALLSSFWVLKACSRNLAVVVGGDSFYDGISDLYCTCASGGGVQRRIAFLARSLSLAAYCFFLSEFKSDCVLRCSPSVQFQRRIAFFLPDSNNVLLGRPESESRGVLLLSIRLQRRIALLAQSLSLVAY
jgi:hypothetical protein